MNQKQHFEKYRSRLMWEGLLKSFLWGAIIGFGLNAFFATLSYFISFSFGFWVSLGLLAFGLIGVTWFCYHNYFCPTLIRNAKRLDRLGLEERLVTMLDYEKDNSYIARLQREDAKQKLSTINPKNIKFNISKVVCIVAACVCALGVFSTTVLGLTNAGIIPSWNQVWHEQILGEDYNRVNILYETYGDGDVEGDIEQSVNKGQNGETVVAVPADDYGFAGWANLQGAIVSKNPIRCEINVQNDIYLIALFMPLQDHGGPNGNEVVEGQEGDSKPDKSSQENKGNGHEKGEGIQGGGQEIQNNTILNGKDYYGLFFEEYYQQAIERIEISGFIPENYISFIENYYDIIRKDKEDLEKLY